MPKKYPDEFKADVARVARRGDMTTAEIAADFGISVESVKRWRRQADIDGGSVRTYAAPSARAAKDERSAVERGSAC